MKQPNWYAISKYRDEIFGISIISIIIFHFCESTVTSQVNNLPILQIIFAKYYYRIFGSVGVEIFTFLSGMGLYFSLKRNNNIRRFYRKRFIRILIPYLIWGSLAWIITDLIIEKTTFFRFIYDFTLLSFWIDGNKLLWFIAFILACYIIFPLIFKLVDTSNKKATLSVFIVLLVYGILLKLTDMVFPVFYANTEIALTRLVIFVLGTYFARKIYERRQLKLFDISIFMFGFLLKIIKLNGFGISGRIVSCFFSISIVIILSYSLQLICEGRNCNWLQSIGSISLELYMTHVVIRSVFESWGLLPELWYYYTICIILAVFASITLKRLTNIFNTKILRQ